MESVIRIGRRRPGPRADPLALALALCVEDGMTEAEALCTLHAGVLQRAEILGIRLEGEKE
jgi:hypothetical protein